MPIPARIIFHKLSDQTTVIEAQLLQTKIEADLAIGYNRRGKFYHLDNQTYWEDFNVEISWIQRYNAQHSTSFVSFKEIRLAIDWKSWESFKQQFIISNFPTLISSYQETIQVDENEFKTGVGLATSIVEKK